MNNYIVKNWERKVPRVGDYVGINGRIHSRKYQKDDRVYLNYGFVAEKVDFLR